MKLYEIVVVVCLALINTSFATESEFYAERVQDWFQAQQEDIAPKEATAPVNKDAENTSVHHQKPGKATDIRTLQTPEEEDVSEKLSRRVYEIVKEMLEKVLWTSIGWSIGVSIPVVLLGLAVAYSHYRRVQSEKIQENILAESLSARHQQEVEEVQTSMESQGEIQPSSPPFVKNELNS